MKENDNPLEIFILENLNEDYHFEAIESITENIFNETFNSITRGVFINSFSQCNDNDFRTLLSRINLNEDTELKKAYYIGIWNTLYELQKKASETKINEKTAEKSIKSYKYLKPFIECLYHNNVVNHNELTELLGIKKSSLSNFLRRIKKFNYYSEQKFGTQKLYFITNNGQWLFNIICCNENNKLLQDDFTDYLIRFLRSISAELKEKKPNVEQIFINASKGGLKDPYITRPKIVKKEVECILTNIQKRFIKDNNILLNIINTETETKNYTEIKLHIIIETEKLIDITRRIGSNRRDSYLNNDLFPIARTHSNRRYSYLNYDLMSTTRTHSNNFVEVHSNNFEEVLFYEK